MKRHLEMLDQFYSCLSEFKPLAGIHRFWSVWKCWGVAVFFLFAAGRLCSAETVLNGFFPAGASPGKTVKVKAEGSFETWPCRWWVDRPGISIQCGETKGEVVLTLDPKVGYGRHWVRAYDASGASKLIPFLVCGGESILEKEPNDHPDDAQSLTNTSTVDGRLGKSGDVDCYRIELDEGGLLSARVDANRWLGSPIDLVLQVCDEHGRVLRHQDDGVGLDPVIEYRAPKAGVYMIRVFGFPATPNSTIGFSGGERMVYRLTLSTGASEPRLSSTILGRSLGPVKWFEQEELPVSFEYVHEGNPQNAVVWSPGATGWNNVPCPDGISFHFNSTAQTETLFPGQAITKSGPGKKEGLRQNVVFNEGEHARVRVLAQTLGQPLDPVLRVLNAAGETVATVDDVDGSRDAYYDWKEKADRQLIIEVHDRFDRELSHTCFAISVERIKPVFEVKWSQEVWVGQKGQSTELSLNVKADQDREGDWELVLLEAPEGVEATPTALKQIKKAGEDVKLIVLSDVPSSGPMKAALISKNDLQPIAVALIRLEGVNVDHRLSWLTTK